MMPVALFSFFRMSYAPLSYFGITLFALAAFAEELPEADPFLKVDFGLKVSPVQEGWVAAKTEAGKVTGPLIYEFDGYRSDATIAGKIILTVAGGDRLTSGQYLCARDRGRVQAEGDDFPLMDLYRDFITGPSSITIGISGLKPGATQTLRVYSYDQDREQSVEVKNVSDSGHLSGGEGSLKFIAVAKTSAETAHIAALRMVIPSSGQIIFRVKTLTGGSAVINGLSLSEAKSFP